MGRPVRTVEELFGLLDGLGAPGADRWSGRAADWWDGFYAERGRGVPFFTEKPDESLASYLERGLLRPGRALDLGCGPGRNALHLATAGFTVDAVDLSPSALAWARERARAAGVAPAFHLGDAFAPPGSGPALHGPYDLIHDSGCFHHLPPHRRISHLALLHQLLASGGHFALTCFAAGAPGPGPELPDEDFYRTGGPRGGFAYTPESLRHVFSGFTEIELRRMRDEPPDSPYFGEPFLWTALFRRPEAEQEAGRESGTR